MVLKVLHNFSSQSVACYLSFNIDKGFLGGDGFKGNVHLLDRETDLLRSNTEGGAQMEGLPLTEPPGAPQTEPEQDE